MDTIWHVILMTHDLICNWHEIEYWLENNRVRNDDTELRKNLACLQAYGTHTELRKNLACLQAYGTQV